MTEVTNAVLTSKTGLISKPAYHVFFYPAKQFEQELKKFLKLETGLDLTVNLSGGEDGTNDLYVSIREEHELVEGAEEDMTVREFLEENHDYPFRYCGGYEVARDMVCRMFNLHVNDLAHLQYFGDENEENAQVRMSVSVSHFSGGSAETENESTIAGTYLGRRAVSNMLYFLLKAAQEEIDLSLTVPECTHFEDVVYGTILEWVEDIEKKSESGDPAFTAFEQLLLVELSEGTYLNEGREVFMDKVAKALAPGQDDSKRLFLFQLIERISRDAEAIQQAWR
jgi:hypothetical protein